MYSVVSVDICFIFQTICTIWHRWSMPTAYPKTHITKKQKQQKSVKTFAGRLLRGAPRTSFFVRKTNRTTTFKKQTKQIVETNCRTTVSKQISETNGRHKLSENYLTTLLEKCSKQ
jgi:hypothetical protein